MVWDSASEELKEQVKQRRLTVPTALIPGGKSILAIIDS